MTCRRLAKKKTPETIQLLPSHLGKAKKGIFYQRSTFSTRNRVESFFFSTRPHRMGAQFVPCYFSKVFYIDATSKTVLLCVHMFGFPLGPSLPKWRDCVLFIPSTVLDSKCSINVLWRRSGILCQICLSLHVLSSPFSLDLNYKEKRIVWESNDF